MLAIGTACRGCGASTPRGASFCPSCGAAIADGRNPYLGLIEAARLVAADAGRDLDATLDTLTEQARRLLGADSAALQLAVSDEELEVRRPARSVSPDSPFALPGTRFRPGAFTREAISLRRPLFTPDFQGDPRHARHFRDFGPVVAAMVVPLLDGERLVGTLYLDWYRPVQVVQREIDLADAFGQHAAIAIRTARLVEEAQRTRAELEAVLDAVDDGIAVYAADGPLLHLNRWGRENYERVLGRVPATWQDLHGLVELVEIDDMPLGRAPSIRALHGESATAVEVIKGPDGQQTWKVYVAAFPVLGADGAVRAFVILWRDITELYESIARDARLEGALKTALRVTHELGNQLSPVVGYGELLARAGVEISDPAIADMVRRMYVGALEAGRTLKRLGSIMRYEQSEFGGTIMLDLDAATTPGGD